MDAAKLTTAGKGHLVESVLKEGADDIALKGASAADDVIMNTAQSLPAGGTGQIGAFTQYPNAIAGNTVADVGLSNIPMAGGQAGMANSFPATMGGAGPATYVLNLDFLIPFLLWTKLHQIDFKQVGKLLKKNHGNLLKIIHFQLQVQLCQL